jgi:hypothetical protein
MLRIRCFFMKELVQKPTQIIEPLEQDSEDADDDGILLKRVHINYDIETGIKLHYSFILQQADLNNIGSRHLLMPVTRYQ